jgi:hypothetical protein
MLKDFICELEAQVEQWAHNKFIGVIEGKREELVGRLQAKYGLTKEQAEEKVDDWVKKL